MRLCDIAKRWHKDSAIALCTDTHKVLGYVQADFVKDFKDTVIEAWIEEEGPVPGFSDTPIPVIHVVSDW